MPRKTLKEQKGKRPTDTDKNVNRIRSVIDGLVGNEYPDDVMLELVQVLEESSASEVQSGKYYVFNYGPKTPNIEYDSNPLVAVTDVFSWGFRGINFHWKTKASSPMRQYTWNEVTMGIYEIYSSELKDVESLPFQNFKLNN